MAAPGRPEQEHALAPGSSTLGRAADCEIVINHESLSRRHAVLTVAGRNVTLRDNNSTNGVFVDDQEVTEAPLEAGKRFRLGADVEVRLELK